MKSFFNNKNDRIFNFFNYFFLTLVIILTIYPLYFVIIASISDPDAVNSGAVIWRPLGLTLEGYNALFKENAIWIGYRNTIGYTVIGTIVNVILTMMIAYPLASKQFKYRHIVMIFLIITMYFRGGIIPTYLVVKNLGLLDTWPVMILVGAIGVFNVIIARTFIQNSIPEELYEAAVMDGCGPIYYFIKVVFPLSKALLAVLSLYYGVAHWNEFFKGLIYIRNADLYPLQLVLREILLQNEITLDQVAPDEALAAKEELANLIRYGVIVLASLPMLVFYPFIQKYFVKGATIGSVKG